jgi:tetratricopeptide (TPR) repeat protein
VGASLFRFGSVLLAVPTAVLVWASCGPSDQSDARVRSYTHPPLNVVPPATGPTPPTPAAADAGAGDGGLGSGIPLDAQPNQVPAESPPAKVARGTGTPADNLLVEGDALYAKGDYAAAEKAYKKAAALEVKDPAPIVGQVRARLGKDNVSTEYNAAPKSAPLAAAVRDLQRAIKLDDKYAPAHLELGRALLVLGKAHDAKTALKRAVELAPSDAEAHSALGVAHVAQGELDAAVVELTRAAELAPGDAPRQTNLGAALLLKGRTQEAIRAFERAVRLAPRDARVQNDLGTALLGAAEPARAIPHLEAAVAAEPQKATYRSNLGYAHHLKGDVPKAMSLYREALKLDDKLASAWINLGNALAQTGKRKEAREAYEKAKALDPSDPRVQAVIQELDAIEKGPAPPPKKP